MNRLLCILVLTLLFALPAHGQSALVTLGSAAQSGVNPAPQVGAYYETAFSERVGGAVLAQYGTRGQSVSFAPTWRLSDNYSVMTGIGFARSVGAAHPITGDQSAEYQPSATVALRTSLASGLSFIAGGQYQSQVDMGNCFRRSAATDVRALIGVGASF